MTSMRCSQEIVLIHEALCNDTTDGGGHVFSGCKSRFCADPSLVCLLYSTKSVARLRPFSRNRRNHYLQKSAVICAKDFSFRFGSVPENLHCPWLHIAKTEQYARWREYMKRDRVSFDRFHFLPTLKRNAFWEAAISFGKSVSDNDSHGEKAEDCIDLDLPFVSDRTVNPSTQKGNISAVAISSIEQFGRMVGLTGEQMKSKFYSQVPVAVQNEARNLVEYCCFYYLSTCGKDFHPSIKDGAFRALMFITMLAWQQPYENNASNNYPGSHNFEKPSEKIRTWVVGEDAFARLAPAIPGVADRPTARHLFKAITGSHDGLTLGIWDTYLSELLSVHEERVQHREEAGQTLSLAADESVLCVGAKRRQPVQMWNKNNMTWPGRLTLTDQALYFEPNGLLGHQKPVKLSLAEGGASVQRKKVGPFGAPLLDSAIEITADDQSEPWVLEFVDLTGEGRREVWLAFINEIISIHSFIHEYGPAADDPLVPYVSGSEHGGKKALASAANGIARVQAVQSTVGSALEHPGRLLQFSYSANAPCGELVLQSLAVHFWSGRVEDNHKDMGKTIGNGNGLATDDTIWTDAHVVDIDGSVYLRRWMKSPTWDSSRSLSFWKKRAGDKALSLGKELLVGELTDIDRAVKVCKDRSQMAEETKFTVDGALLKGIPSNIDLFKELLLPFSILSTNIKKLRKWENPVQTVLFLSVFSVIIYMKWLKFIFPALLLASAVLVLAVRISKWQGRLGDLFGRVTIKEQPPSNTLQKIFALKEALEDLEVQIQKVNIALLKLRTLALSGLPQATNKVILALFGSALILAFVPFRYVCAVFLVDQFTYELGFRRGLVLKFESELTEWWQAIPAAPVVVLPCEGEDKKNLSKVSETLQPTTGDMIAEAVREWFADSE